MDTTKTWGYYKPSLKAWPLLALIQIGLARGGLKKRLVHTWIKRFGPILDIERSGIKYRLGLNDNVTDRRILTSSKRYDRPEIEALAAACQNDVFVDLGANIGFYSLSLAYSGSNVLAIEPNPAALERLRYNAQLNSFAGRIEIVPYGVGKSGEFQLSDKGDLGSASIHTDDVNQSVTITAKTTT
jgi:hypothetical protein